MPVLCAALALRLDDEYPSAAGSVREGREETLTVVTLQLFARLQRSVTNCYSEPDLTPVHRRRNRMPVRRTRTQVSLLQ